MLLLVSFEAGERRERGLLSRRRINPLSLHFRQPRLAGHHRQREQDCVLDQVPDIQGLDCDEVIFLIALLLDPGKLGLPVDQHQPVLHRDLVPESLETGLTGEKNEAFDYTRHDFPTLPVEAGRNAIPELAFAVGERVLQPFQLGGRRPTPHAAVKKAETGASVTQEVAWVVTPEKAECKINGTVVASYPKAELVGAGKLESLDGIAGIRVAHNVDVNVSNWKITK